MSDLDDLGLEAPQRSKEQLKEDLVVAERTLQSLKNAKKQIVKQYQDDIKDCEAQIEGIMEQLQ